MDDMIHEVPPTRPDEAPLTLAELLAARSQLEEEIARLRAETIENVKRYIAEFNISSAELFGKVRKALPPKYKDPATGKTWTGKGKPPAWIKDLDEVQRDALRI